MPTEEQILQHIGKQSKQQVSFKQLLREMGVRGEARRQLKDDLSKLVREGMLVESRGEIFSMPRGGKFVAGRLVRHHDGYGFVIPDQPIGEFAGDIFIGELGMGNAMHGDQVLARVSKVDARGRAAGRIQKILKRAHATVVGQFRAGPRSSAVIPWDERITDEILILHREPLPGNADPQDLDGMIVDIELTRFPAPGQPPQGRVTEILGRLGDFGIDVEIIIRKHHLPHRFPAEVIEEAEAASQVLSSRDLEGRRDFRSLPIVTIDGETARDFDDAVYVERLDHGRYQLQVHIADVAHYVRAGRPLDREARLRGTSVYFPDRAVPMLPHELSTGICSLNPQVDRLVVSCIMTIGRHGEIEDYELVEGVIRSAERLTYTSVNLVLEGDPGLRERYKPLIERFDLMKELALVFNEKRRKRGSIDFDLPEPEISFDEFGQMRAITRSERNIAHRLIEEFMLSANETVAGHFDRLGIGSLYRIHEKPNPKRVMDFEEVAATFGYSLGVGGLPVRRFRVQSGRGAARRERGGRHERDVELPAEIHITPRHYQKLTDKIAGKPEERILSYLMLRSLKQARYSELNSGHFALAAPVYTHFTSPIRRYPDLIVHRVLKALLHAGAHPTGPMAEPELKSIADESSEAERRAQNAERELLEWKKVTFMGQRLGEQFDGLITSVAKFGFFVELTEMFVEGLVHISSLDDDHYYYRETSREIVSEHSRRRFRIGDRVKVIVERVDPVALKINFGLVE